MKGLFLLILYLVVSFALSKSLLEISFDKGLVSNNTSVVVGPFLAGIVSAILGGFCILFYKAKFFRFGTFALVGGGSIISGLLFCFFQVADAVGFIAIVGIPAVMAGFFLAILKRVLNCTPGVSPRI